jgi:cell division ATPase FtsA
MLGFSNSDHKSAVVIDVGSSSVGVAIVCIHAQASVEIIWEHREYGIIHDDASPANQARQIKTALTNAFLELTSTGLKTLKTTEHDTDISEIQVVVAAPWSYTLTKTITLKDEHPFTVTKDLIGELVESAEKQSKLVFATDKLAKSLGLEITHGDVLGIDINGYQVTEPLNQEGRNISLSYSQTAISEEILNTINEAADKFFPKAKVTQYSFMYVFYLTMRNLHPNTSEICLIDVTGEATEIGIVRDEVLQHTTFTQSGTYTIARDLAKASGIPKEEAYSYMKDIFKSAVERLPKSTTEKMSATVNDYAETIGNSFLRTGDKLTIPKTIFLHTDARTEDFFVEELEQAAYNATGKKHTVHPITAKILGIEAKTDTALIMSMSFLANKEDYFKLLPSDI